MTTSFNQTKTFSDLYITTQKGSITKLINDAFTKNPDYKYYHITNDDFIYKTTSWDKIIIDKLEFKGGGIAYANDLFSSDLPTAPFITGDYARVLGWLQLPTLKHLSGDLVWRQIGLGLNRLYYLNEVIIEHKQEKDGVYEKTNSQEMYKKDGKAFKEWLYTQCPRDIEAIRHMGV
ncbi:MAG: hypothetical protein ACE5H1_00815 [Thermodesulfobacteriota bacterium]